MTLLGLVLILIVAAVVIYCVRLALAGNWKELIITAVILLLALWLLGALGLSLPNLPTLR